MSPPVVYHTLSYPVHENKINMMIFHKMLGHCGSDRLEKNAKIQDVKLNGEFKTYEKCAIAKARQKNINKD
jgi:hypothetical protein